MWFRGSGINRHPGDDTGQKEAQREPCAVAAAGEGNPRPPARDGAWGGAQRRAVHFLFGARRLPQRCAPWACVGAGRAPLSLLVSGTAARLGTEQRQPPSPPRAARSAPELVLAAEPQPNCEEGSRLRLLVPSFLSPSLPLSRPGGRPQFQARAGLFCGRGLHLYTNCLSLASVHFGTGTGGLFSKSLFLIAPALQITSGNLWEEPSGWKMLLRFAQGRKLCHPAGYLCHA